VRGFFSNEGVKEGYPLEKRYVAAIGSSRGKAVADRLSTEILLIITDAGMGFLLLSTSMTLNDLKVLKVANLAI